MNCRRLALGRKRSSVDADRSIRRQLTATRTAFSDCAKQQIDDVECDKADKTNKQRRKVFPMNVTCYPAPTYPTEYENPNALHIICQFCSLYFI
jgi:hypothetical protein